MTINSGACAVGPAKGTVSTIAPGVTMQAGRNRWLPCAVFGLVALFVTDTVRAGIVSQYAFDGATLNRSATTVAANVVAGDITDAPKVNNNSTISLVRTTSVGYSTDPVLSAARANFNESSVRDNVYFTFTVSPNSGNVLNLSNLTFNVAQGGGVAGTRDYDIRTSLDGFSTSLTGIVPIPSVRPTFTGTSVDLSGSQFQTLASPITFQFRIFTPTVSQNIDFDNITLNGAVSAVPEPAPVALLGIAASWILLRQQYSARRLRKKMRAN